MEGMGEIYKLIPQIMAEVGSVEKTRKNQQQGYAFRGIEDMYLAVHPAMVKFGVFCAPIVLERNERVYEKINTSGNSVTWIHVSLKVEHRFFASDGSCVSVITCGEGLDNSDKATNKAMSGAMKYALIELLLTPTQDIDDADRTSPEAGKKTETIKEPIVLKPKTTQIIPEAAAPVKPPDGPKALPFEPEYIDTKQKQNLAKRFRESLREERQKEENELRHACLVALSQSELYKSKFIDDHGNPTSELILKSEYDSIGRAMVKAAKSL